MTNLTSLLAICFLNIWPVHDRKFKTQESGSKFRRYDASVNKDLHANPFLPKITMVGISMGEGGQTSKANLKKTLEDLTKELEQASQKPACKDEKDPLFVANVGDYSRIAKISSTCDSSMKSGNDVLYVHLSDHVHI